MIFLRAATALTTKSTIASSSPRWLYPLVARSPSFATAQNRWYTPMSKEQEEEEQKRVAALTPFQKDMELRQLNREIALLEMKRGINTGDLYTWKGQYKDLARNYGLPLAGWYFVVWSSTAVLCFLGIQSGGIDAIAVISQIDATMGWSLASRIEPEWGTLGLALLLNELLEPVRLPIVVSTVKPVADKLFPLKV